MIAFGRRTGYDIKQLVDRSTRHFWAASYGQIYPELRRLEEQGLIEGHPEPSGGRARIVYELTDDGRSALDDWLGGGPPLLYEVRDEGLLRLFFSDLADPGQRLATVHEMREGYAAKLAQLKALRDLKGPEMPPGPRLTLELGLGLTAWLVDWCDETERRLEREATDAR
jgi:PadR family transcriptional regulator, regulatory protein AphA